MSLASFFEVHVAIHQRGFSGTDYGLIHRLMEKSDFERVIQTTAQSANEVPGIYRLRKPRFTMAQVADTVRRALDPLARAMSVRIMKVEEELIFDIVPAVDEVSGTGTRLKPSRQDQAQSGYPTWKRPR